MGLTPAGWKIVAAAVTVVVAIPVGRLTRTLVLQRLRRITEQTRWTFDDALVDSLRRPLPVWIWLASVFLAIRIASPPPQWTELVDRLVAVSAIISLTLWGADLGVRLLRVATAKPDGSALLTGVVVNVTRIGVLGLGGLVLLNTLGISITPILTTIGVGGLAVALGLQDTLANLFAGVHVTLAGNLRVGDYVKLESGDEGYIEDIRWRATRIRTLPGNIVLIPNARLAQNIVTNYHLPAPEMSVLVQVGVHYASDLDHVERVVCEVGAAVLATFGGASGFTPFIRYHTFGESSVDFTVILRVREFVDQYLIKHEFVKALARRFSQEGIVIPFPIRAINLDQERAGTDSGPSTALSPRAS